MFDCLETESCAGPCGFWCCSPVLGEFWVQKIRVSEEESKAGLPGKRREVSALEQLFAPLLTQTLEF